MDLHILEFMDCANGFQVSSEYHSLTSQSLIMNSSYTEMKLKNRTMVHKREKPLNQCLLCNHCINSIQESAET